MSNQNPERSALTLRAVAVGIVVGVSVSISNIYFGLQIGWSSSMSNQSALLGFAAFKVVSKHLRRPFTPQENVIIQTVAGAVGCMPVTAGLTGVIPALEYLISAAEQGPLPLRYSQLVCWSLGVCLIGLIWAMMFRTQIVVREKLPWPGPVATAAMITVLHNNEKLSHAHGGHSHEDNSGDEQQTPLLATDPPSSPSSLRPPSKIKALILGGAGSGLFTLFTYFLPVIHNAPIFGNYLRREWLWSINISTGFIGSGIITGPIIPLHMLAGAVVGWAILSPVAKKKGWAPGKVDDWETGSRGWIMWVSLAALITDCLVKLSWLVLKPTLASKVVKRLVGYLRRSGHDESTPYQPLTTQRQPAGYVQNDGTYSSGQDQRPMSGSLGRSNIHTSKSRHGHGEVGSGFLYALLAMSVVICTVAVQLVFRGMISILVTVTAAIVSLPLGLMGMRAVAETDWNPMSGIGKLSQLVFALIVPRSDKYNVIINLIAGGLAEAGASQAGDMGYDLKVGHLLDGRPEDQMYGQIIGSVVGSLIGVALYRLYTSVYKIPSDLFPIPISHIFLLAARLVTGTGLPEGAVAFASAVAAFFAVGTIIKIRYAKFWWHNLIPGGVAFGVGMYNAPSFTLARAIGGFIYWFFVMRRNVDHEYMIVLAGALVLGEGLASILNLCLAAANVPTLA